MEISVFTLSEHFFRDNFTATQAFSKYNTRYPERPVCKHTFFRAYKKLCSGLPIGIKVNSVGRPRSINDDFLDQLVRSDPFLTAQKLAVEDLFFLKNSRFLF